METVLDFCAGLLLLTGGFIVVTLWLAFIVLFTIEVRDNLKERGSNEEEEL